MTNLLIPDLLPNTQYVVEVRAVRTNGVSEWSNRKFFTTVNDTVLPLTPVNITWAVSGDGFAGSWDTTSLNVNNEVINIVRYEVELVANSLTRILSVNQTTAGTIYYNLSFEDNRQLFGTPQPTVQMRVRAVSNIDTKSAWSAPLSASNPVPGAPTAVTAVAGNNQIGLTWTPPADVDLIGYNIYLASTKLTFVNATSWTYYTTNYSSTALTVKAVDKFNQESTGANSNSVTPTNPSTVDTTAPNTPTALAGTITNNANGIGAIAALSWTMTSPPSDLAGYYVRYRRVGDTNYQTVNFPKDALTGNVELNSAYTNYEFQIKAFDWSNNESAWSTTLTVTSPSNAAPANVTGLASVAGRDSITYTWTPVADTDIKNYEVTFSTSPTFASGNFTYFTGESTTLTVGGLTPSTTYYARVRAVDTSGVASASFSSTDTKATTAFPSTPLTDTYAPQSSPTPNVMSGLSYLYANWTPVTLNSNGGAQVDPVTYEVHLSTTTGFTPSGATKVTEVTGTFAIIDILPGTTTPLSYGTTYYVKLIAKDRDGSAAAGAQGSGSISKVASGDVTSIGADLIVPGTGIINNLIINTGGGLQSANYSAGTAGYRLDQSGLEINNGSVKASLLTAGTLTSSTGVIQIGAGASLVLNGGYLKSNTYTGTSYNSGATAGFYLGNDGLVIAQGTVKAEAFAGGSFTAGTITMGAGGSITGGSWTLNSSGLTIPNGAINAAALNIQIGANMMPPLWADFEGVSTLYPANLSGGTLSTAAVSTAQKYNNSQSMLVTSTAAALRTWYLGTSATDYNVKLAPSTRYIISVYIYNSGGATATGYLGIKQQDGTLVNGTSGTIANTAAWTRYSYVVTTTSAATSGVVTINLSTNATLYFDAVQIEQAINSTVTSPSPWAPPGATLIDGGMIRTGAIQSTALGNVWDAATNGYIAGTLPAWSIDTAGAATFSNLNVLGSVVVGNQSDIANSAKYIVGSAGYQPGQFGWIMHGDGWVEFNQIVANSIDGNSIRANTISVNKLSGGQVGANGHTVDIQIVGGGGISMYKFGDDPAVAGTLPIVKLNPTDGLIIDPPGPSSITVPTAANLPIVLDKVSLNADTATFNGNIRIYGSNNYISGDLALEKAIENPTFAPAVTSAWSDPSTYLQAGVPPGWQTFGLSSHQTAGYWITGIFNGVNDARLWYINQTTGVMGEQVSNPVITRTFTGPFQSSGSVSANPDLVRGVGRLNIGGTYYYAMLLHYPAQSGSKDINNGYDWNGVVSYNFNAEWRISLWAYNNSNGASPNLWWSLGVFGVNIPFLSTDDTYIYIGYNYNSSPNAFQINRYNYDGTGSTTAASSTSAYNTDVTCVYVGSANFGSNRYLIGGAGNTFYSLTGVGVANDTATAFDKANYEHAWGLIWDGTQFRSITISGKIYKYSNYTGADTSATWTYSWYDTNNSSTGAVLNPDRGNYKHMTLLSPSTSYTYKRRWWTKFSISATIPGAGGTDDPDSIKIFINGIPQPDLTVGQTSVIYNSYVTSTPVGEVIPTRNEFIDIARSGTITSKITDANGPLIVLKGDGSGRTGPLTWTSSGDVVWNVWNPGFTNLNVGNGTVTARWTRIGTRIRYRLLVIFGSTSSITAGVKFTLPASARADVNQYTDCLVIANGGTTPLMGRTFIASNSTDAFPYILGNGTSTTLGQLGTFSVTMGTGAYVESSGEYESA